MVQKNITALTSLFSRWYHFENEDGKIFEDSIAGLLLNAEEKEAISENMSKGIQFFNPEFSGTQEEALRWIVDNQLSPSPIGRAAFGENHLLRAVELGTTQYLILASGYDSFAYRKPIWGDLISIFEIDLPEIIQDKKKRLEASEIDIPENVFYISADFNKLDLKQKLLHNMAFSPQKISFCSLMGISYYLSKETFGSLISDLSELLPKGSSIVFDYPDQDNYTDRAGERSKKQTLLAASAKEAMLASYSLKEIERILEKHKFLVYEHLVPTQITQQFFSDYNQQNPFNKITAFDNVNYCLAVKQ